jgi:hypothetical protein
MSEVERLMFEPGVWRTRARMRPLVEVDELSDNGPSPCKRTELGFRTPLLPTDPDRL